MSVEHTIAFDDEEFPEDGGDPRGKWWEDIEELEEIEDDEEDSWKAAGN